MIESRRLRQLIQLMIDNDLSELDLRDKEEQVTLKRASGGSVQYVPAPQAPAASAPDASSGQAPPAPSDEVNSGLVEITSPMVGTFYAAASPDADPFVRVGTTVDPETVVCLIEAMKVFNEIRSEMSGTVERVLVGNGQPVEFGQPLFVVRPA
jgi:acetyl-CoA carboxylase biotin carboxyl carrier protein